MGTGGVGAYDTGLERLKKANRSKENTSPVESCATGLRIFLARFQGKEIKKRWLDTQRWQFMEPASHCLLFSGLVWRILGATRLVVVTGE